MFKIEISIRFGKERPCARCSALPANKESRKARSVNPGESIVIPGQRSYNQTISKLTEVASIEDLLEEYSNN